MTGPEQVLINDWCQQYPSHSVGDLRFGADGALYVSGGDGASWTDADYGQFGGSDGSPTPKNPCGDPPGGVGVASTTPTADGAVRCDPRAFGAPVGAGPAQRRASCGSTRRPAWRWRTTRCGRQPTRTRAGSWATASAIRSASRSARARTSCGSATSAGTTTRRSTESPNPLASTVANFGWPCYEGPARQPAYETCGLDMCTSLYARRRASVPVLLVYATVRRSWPARPAAVGRLGDRRRDLLPGSARTRRSTRTRSSSRTTRGTASGR